MQNTFIFVNTDYEVVPENDGELKKVLKSIVKRTLIVETPDFIGAAVMIGDTIVTSLFLVRNFKMVNIRFGNGSRSQALVIAKDERNYIAKLQECDLSKSERAINKGKIKIDHIREIGSPLLTTNTSSGKPIVCVAGTKYAMHLCERKEELLKIHQGSPRGIMGSGVWNDSGALIGLSIGQQIPLFADQIPTHPRVYALPAEEVMEFVEKKI